MKIHGLDEEIPIPLATDQLSREIARLQTTCDEQAKRIAELQATGTELVEARREAEHALTDFRASMGDEIADLRLRLNAALDLPEQFSHQFGVAGLGIRCAHCGGLLAPRKVYRCMDCRLPHHRRCLFIHCERNSVEKGGEGYLDALRGIA